jgi:hypothetical protein
MGKKIAIGVIIILLAVTAIVYIGIWNAQKERAAVPAPQVPVVSIDQPVRETADTAKTKETVKSVDSDVAGIEADLDSVSDDSFGEDNLSDAEVGL